MTERFKNPIIRQEVGKLVRSNTLEALDTPDALPIFVGERLDSHLRRDLRVCHVHCRRRRLISQYLLLWAPVSPVSAITYFQPRFGNDPIVLQYAHRALEQHPVDVTFFYVPQVVQALRFDELGM